MSFTVSYSIMAIDMRVFAIDAMCDDDLPHEERVPDVLRIEIKPLLNEHFESAADVLNALNRQLLAPAQLDQWGKAEAHGHHWWVAQYVIRHSKDKRPQFVSLRCRVAKCVQECLPLEDM